MASRREAQFRRAASGPMSGGVEQNEQIRSAQKCASSRRSGTRMWIASRKYDLVMQTNIYTAVAVNK